MPPLAWNRVRPSTGQGRAPRVPGWPGRCGICLAWTPGGGVCRACLDAHAPTLPRCLSCAAQVPPGVAHCGRCLAQPPVHVRAVAAFDYVFPWDRAITSFKFRDGLGWTDSLARALCDAVAHAPDAGGPAGAQVVTPVPLSDARLRERGYNQAWEIARRVARWQGLPAHHDLLRRLRDTPHQASLDRAGRAANLQGVFMPDGPAARAAVQGRVVALVDDVFTTGATAGAAAAALLEAGASAVHVWVLARTPALVER